MPKPKKPFEFDYEAVKNKALAQLKTGKPLLGKEGALTHCLNPFWSCMSIALGILSNIYLP
jgi:hypothetical protein